MTGPDPVPERPWLREGEPVIVASGWSGGAVLREVQVAKLTRTQIVIEGGTRFRLRDLHQIGGGGTWSGTPRILDSADPRTRVEWLEYQQRALRRNLQQQVEKLMGEFVKDGDTAPAWAARDLIADLAARHDARAAEIRASGQEHQAPATTERSA